ncbi:serine/threonine protein phosphatase [Jannaschia sp. Os4]|uniref:metallophosphoesterase family protein n=1 Tax=Jannaschia sp. Os4 TaxID=2807617 RepID=UPI001939B208|nr:metallophosphoesterase family protein [Jannaschia sp. Os4]MBM2575878.1 serine/threonine protein phosphatase [Jannaschia sp. Os4]
MIYAVGDIHGHPAQLDRVLALIEADGGPDAEIVFLGDYVDRGPDARAVIDRLAAGWAEGRPWTFLLGNHDRMFRSAVTGGPLRDPGLREGLTWLHPRLGGRDTLKSYLRWRDRPRAGRWDEEVPDEADPRLAKLRAAMAAAVPERHLAFLDALVPMHLAADHAFVHAGIRPDVPLGEQVEDDLVWIREPFLSDPTDHGRLVVHGHTPVDRPEHRGNRLNLDTGAGYGRPAAAAALDGPEAWHLTEAGRVPIRPPVRRARA